MEELENERNDQYEFGFNQWIVDYRQRSVDVPSNFEDAVWAYAKDFLNGPDGKSGVLSILYDALRYDDDLRVKHDYFMMCRN